MSESDFQVPGLERGEKRGRFVRLGQRGPPRKIEINHGPVSEELRDRYGEDEEDEALVQLQVVVVDRRNIEKLRVPEEVSGPARPVPPAVEQDLRPLVLHRRLSRPSLLLRPGDRRSEEVPRPGQQYGDHGQCVTLLHRHFLHSPHNLPVPDRVHSTLVPGLRERGFGRRRLAHRQEIFIVVLFHRHSRRPSDTPGKTARSNSKVNSYETTD